MLQPIPAGPAEQQKGEYEMTEEKKKEFYKLFTEDITVLTSHPQRYLRGNPEEALQWIEQKLKEARIDELEFNLCDAKKRGTDLRLTIKSRLNFLKEK